MKTKHIIFVAVVRVLQAVLIQTFFQPDEYFQSLEVAHHAVFGYGHLTWEWSTSNPIRSILFPSLWIPVYWLLKISGLDETNALIVCPKILQGFFAAITDVSVCRLSRRLFGREYTSLTLLVSLTSFFHGLALVRTLSNSLETSLTVLALSHWPAHSPPAKSFQTLLLPLLIASVACIVRPTNAILWLYLCAEFIFQSRFSRKAITNIFSAALFVGVLSVGTMSITDSLYFGKPTFTPVNFLRVNASSVSLFYGGNPWHYYLTQAIPILLTTKLPLFFHGIFLTLSGRTPSPQLRTYARLIGWTLLVYSVAGHKEWRFIHPLLPLMHLFCVSSLCQATREIRGKSKLASILLTPSGFCILLSLPAIVYTTFIHGRAQIAVMHHLRGLAHTDLTSIGFLTPCHSTPWASYLHRKSLDHGHAWSLGCEPPLNTPPTYMDQTTIFHHDPIAYLRINFPSTVDSTFPPSPYPTTIPGSSPSFRTTWIEKKDMVTVAYVDQWRHTWPKYLVMFGVLPQMKDQEGTTVADVLHQKGYKRVWRTWNGFEEDEKRRGGVEVWRWTST